MIKNFTITITCPFCGKSHSVTTTTESYHSWNNGELIQDAMPFLSATEREQLISHICPTCQEDFFGIDHPEESPGIEDDHYLREDDDCGFDPYAGCYTDDC